MRLPTILAVTALTVAVLGSTPIGHAAKGLVLPSNSVGTAQLRKDAVTAAKVKNGTLVAADFKRGQLPTGAPGSAGPKGDKGDRGERGEKGDKGEKGDPATRSWAVVNRDATIARQSGGISVGRIGTGFYSVTFDRDVSNCAVIATAENGWVAITQPAGPRVVYADVYNGIARADWLFHIAAFC
jgi:hypothetical protein